MNEWLPLILSSGGLLAGLAAIIAVFVNRKSSKETIKIDHSNVVLEGYNELVSAVQTQVDKLEGRIQIMSVTIERQDEKIQQLRIELRDRDDQIRMLTLDRDDLVSLVTSPRPNLRTL